jgi:hypothetical protein
LRAVEAPEGANVHLTIRGEAGCTWIVRRTAGEWAFGSDRGVEPFAALWIDQEDVWRLYTKGISKTDVLPRIEQAGDPAALAAMLGMVTVLA